MGDWYANSVSVLLLNYPPNPESEKGEGKEMRREGRGENGGRGEGEIGGGRVKN